MRRNRPNQKLKQKNNKRKARARAKTAHPNQYQSRFDLQENYTVSNLKGLLRL
jgi:hypothetical protein